MKKLLLPGIIAFTIFSLLPGCNKEKAGGGAIDDTNLGYTTPKSAKLSYTATKGDAKGTVFTQAVSNFKDSSGYRVATITTSIPGTDPVSSAILYNKEQTIAHSAIPQVYYDMVEMMRTQFTTFTHQENPGFLTVPHKPQPGAILSSQTIVASYHGIQKDGNSTSEASFSITNLPATMKGEESITTSLGTFSCVKIEQQMTIASRMVVDNAVLNDTKETTTVYTWLAKGIGVVRTQELDGQSVISESDLTKIE